MLINELIEKNKFKWNEDKTLLTLRNISLNDLEKIFNTFGINNESAHDVFIHAFENEKFKKNRVEKGLEYSDRAIAAQSTFHLLPNTEKYAVPYCQGLASYINTSVYGNIGLISVIPESVGDLFFGRSIRKNSKDSKTEYFSCNYGCTVDKIYMTVGNQDSPYCAYDAMLLLRKMESELIFGFLSFCDENYEKYFSEENGLCDTNAPIFKFEINPSFILIEDFIQQKSKKNNVESFKEKIKKETFYSFFDLSVDLNENFKNIYQSRFSKYFQQRENFLIQRELDNLLEDINKL